MTHRGGKKGRAAFKRAKNVPAQLKERVEDLSQLQLAALLRFIEVLLKSSKPKTRRSKSKSSSHSGKRKPPKNWKANLRKAIHANHRMSPTAKKKALAKLR